MIADVGRTVCSISAPDGDIFYFFNAEIENKATINYFEKNSDNVKYKLVYSDMEKKKKYRALHYSKYYPNSTEGKIPRVVPFSPFVSTSDDLQVISPLYEVITPSLGNLPGRSGINIVFWTNLSENKNTLRKSSSGAFIYDSTKILRFENDKLEEVELDNYSIKLLCSAQITWERLQAIGGSYNDTKSHLTPVVKEVFVLTVQEGNIAIDFSGGGGRGMWRHNHSDNNNGGFAYAVFAPGTSLQPVNWK